MPQSQTMDPTHNNTWNRHRTQMRYRTQIPTRQQNKLIQTPCFYHFLAILIGPWHDWIGFYTSLKNPSLNYRTTFKITVASS